MIEWLWDATLFGIALALFSVVWGVVIMPALGAGLMAGKDLVRSWLKR